MSRPGSGDQRKRQADRFLGARATPLKFRAICGGRSFESGDPAANIRGIHDRSQYLAVLTDPEAQITRSQTSAAASLDIAATTS